MTSSDRLAHEEFIDNQWHVQRPKTIPLNNRPYRKRDAPGNEVVIQEKLITSVMRQIGWLGKSGAFYSLDEEPSDHEISGGYEPMWICVKTTRLTPQASSPF